MKIKSLTKREREVTVEFCGGLTITASADGRWQVDALGRRGRLAPAIRRARELARGGRRAK